MQMDVAVMNTEHPCVSANVIPVAVQRKRKQNVKRKRRNNDQESNPKVSLS